ncbi:probable G-protein coupled receptor 139 [Scyliorhinus canicula]|uniref:probable G-protein coupled receptor 139 n=1 Tax=Scyliorhinus canicula TaxID=7830 RepID=UPI0018F39D38|nr:probable G-protein coupled receptor 139 [Scyliorhinus canicula]
MVSSSRRWDPATEWRIHNLLQDGEKIFYPLLAVVAVPVNVLTIVILNRGKCGLSKCVTRYLVAMAAADLLVIVFDLIFRQIPVVYRIHFRFLLHLPICNIHAVLLYAATDCSVWFTVTFTFDRFVAISCQKVKSKYCTEKMSVLVLATVIGLSCLKNVFWYFMFTSKYWLVNDPWFCKVTMDVMTSRVWVTIEFFHYILTPGVPFILILLLNIFTIRNILVSSRARQRLRAKSSREIPRDSEMASRKKSIILLFLISGNFILLWTVIMVYIVWLRMYWFGYRSIYIPVFMVELGFMLQLLSCCTNTGIYAVTQARFRVQFKNVLTYPFAALTDLIK